MRAREVQQITAAGQFDPRGPEQKRGQGHADKAERKRREEPVPQRAILLLARQAHHENGEDQRVVGAEQAFEQDQQANRDEVRRVNVHPVRPVWAETELTRPVSRPIFEIAHGSPDA